uniref:hypothetical protein n=1 Tax=Amycolatopsis sp. CA-151526 TaxID=3239921 RepID=UPI003F491FAB
MNPYPSGDDPLAHSIEEILRVGWKLTPQVAHGGTENAVWRIRNPYTDVVTLPEWGAAVVVRLIGGPQPRRRRLPGREIWRHLVPVEVAVAWILTDPDDDGQLAEFLEAQGQHGRLPAEGDRS